MATYYQKFAASENGGRDPKANGALAPFLGFPKLFSAQFDGGGAEYIAVLTDKGGSAGAGGENVFFIVTRDADGVELYKWPELVKRNGPGYWNALMFLTIREKALCDREGIDFDPSLLLEAETDFLTGKTTVYETKLNPFPNDPDYVTSFAYRLNAKRVGPATNQTKACRTVVQFTVKAPGGKQVTMLALVNVHLRIGIIIGVTGEVTGGDPVAQIVKTVIDVAKIVVGIVQGNVVMIVAAIADIVETWWQYAESLEKARVNAKALGAFVENQGQVKGEKPAELKPANRRFISQALDGSGNPQITQVRPGFHRVSTGDGDIADIPVGVLAKDGDGALIIPPPRTAKEIAAAERSSKTGLWIGAAVVAAVVVIAVAK